MLLMELSREERLTLGDICKDVNRRLHHPVIYQTLLGKGLIFRTLGGYWSPTPDGLKQALPVSERSPEEEIQADFSGCSLPHC